MTEATVAQPGTVALEPPSTVLNPETVSHGAGQGKPDLSRQSNDGSIASVLEAELKSLREAEEKAEADKPAQPDQDKPEPAKSDDKPAKEPDKSEKPEKAEKPRSEDGKFAKVEKEPAPKAEQGAPDKAAAGQEATERRQSEGPHREPPARFLPEARTKWANVPNEVKAEIHRVSQEYESEIAQGKEAREVFDGIKQFHEMAKGANTTLAAAMQNYVTIDQMLRQHPEQGMARILATIGLTPQQYAEHVLKNPQAHQFQAQQQSAPQAQNPQLQQLAQRVDMLTQHIVNTAQSQQAAPVIQEFANSHPDFPSLQGQIATILKSGIIDQIYGSGLNPMQKLEQAYRMAGGSSPSQSAPEPASVHSDVIERPATPGAGTKSVRGAPTNGNDPPQDDTETDLHEMLRKEMRKFA